jgi:glycine dehydrogenase subunit 1
MDAVMFCARMCNRGVFAGVPIDKLLVGHERGLLIAATETKSHADLQAYVKHASACLQES